MNGSKGEKGEWSPGTLLELSGGYWATCTLHAGVKLGVFSALGEERMLPAALAARLGTDERALAMLLDALTAMKLLHKTASGYENTAEASRYLDLSSEAYLGHIILHHHHLVESWARLDRAVRLGPPVRKAAKGEEEEERRESFLMGMYNLASQLAPVLVPQLPLEGKRRLLDLGGGPGTYAIHCCLHNPELTAVVYDLPSTRPFAEACIARFGLRDRIDFVPGDFLHDPLPEGFDVAWLSHVLHGEGPGECRRMLAKTAGSLEPGGMVLIHEFILNDERTGPLFPALFSLNMLLGTEAGQAYAQKEVFDLLTASGFQEPRRLSLDLPGPSGVIVARN